MLAVPESESGFLRPLRGAWCALWPGAAWEGEVGRERLSQSQGIADPEAAARTCEFYP